MIRKLVITLAALAAFASSAGAETLATLNPPHPKLKAEAVVAGNIVRIGDLVANAGIIANVPIFRAPDLGTTGTVSAAAVVEAVRAHQLIGLDTGGIQDVLVTHAARTIQPAAIRHAITAALSAQYAMGPAKNVTLNLDRPLRPQHVALTAKGTPHVLHLGYDELTGDFEATVEIPGGAPVQVTGQARAMVNILTVARPIGRGDIIKQADIIAERHPRSQVGRHFIIDRKQVIGMAARINLEPGQLLRTADLMKPELVRRNQAVTLIYQVPGITLTVRGKATEGGAEGDVISVLNVQSKRTLEGVVVGPGRVKIDSGGRQLADNIPSGGNAGQ